MAERYTGRYLQVQYRGYHRKYGKMPRQTYRVTEAKQGISEMQKLGYRVVSSGTVGYDPSTHKISRARQVISGMVQPGRSSYVYKDKVYSSPESVKEDIRGETAQREVERGRISPPRISGKEVTYPTFIQRKRDVGIKASERWQQQKVRRPMPTSIKVISGYAPSERIEVGRFLRGAEDIPQTKERIEVGRFLRGAEDIPQTKERQYKQIKELYEGKRKQLPPTPTRLSPPPKRKTRIEKEWIKLSSSKAIKGTKEELGKGFAGLPMAYKGYQTTSKFFFQHLGAMAGTSSKILSSQREGIPTLSIEGAPMKFNKEKLEKIKKRREEISKMNLGEYYKTQSEEIPGMKKVSVGATALGFDPYFKVPTKVSGVVEKGGKLGLDLYFLGKTIKVLPKPVRTTIDVGFIGLGGKELITGKTPAEKIMGGIYTGIGFLGGGSSILKRVRKSYIRTGATRIPPEKLFDVRSLRKEETLPLVKNIRESQKAFEEVHKISKVKKYEKVVSGIAKREETILRKPTTIVSQEYYSHLSKVAPHIRETTKVITAGRGKIPKGEIWAGRKGKIGLEDPGIFVSPYGRGSPYFLRIGKQKPTEYTWNLLKAIKESWKMPTATTFTLRKIKRLPRGIIKKPGFLHLTKYYEKQKGKGFGHYTKRSEIGLGEIKAQQYISMIDFKLPLTAKSVMRKGKLIRLKEGEIVKKGDILWEQGTTELEGLVPYLTKITYKPTKFIGKLKGFEHYTEIGGELIPIRKAKVQKGKRVTSINFVKTISKKTNRKEKFKEQLISSDKLLREASYTGKKYKTHYSKIKGRISIKDFDKVYSGISGVSKIGTSKIPRKKYPIKPIKKYKSSIKPPRYPPYLPPTKPSKYLPYVPSTKPARIPPYVLPKKISRPRPAYTLPLYISKFKKKTKKMKSSKILPYPQLKKYTPSLVGLVTKRKAKKGIKKKKFLTGIEFRGI